MKSLDNLFGDKNLTESIWLLLKNPDPVHRAQLAYQIGETKNSKASKALIKALEIEDSVKVREEIFRALAKIDHFDAEVQLYLLKILEKSKDEDFQEKIIVLLGENKLPCPQVTQKLKQILTKNPKANLRVASVRALGNFKDPKFLPELEKALFLDKSPAVRSAAAWAIGQISSDGKNQTILSKAIFSELNSQVKGEILESINKNNIKIDPEFFYRALEMERDLDFQKLLVRFLALSPFPQKKNFIKKILSNQQFSNIVHEELVLIIFKNLRDPDLIQFLIEIFPQEPKTTKLIFLWGFSQIQSPAMKNILKNLYQKEQDEEIKKEILWAINEIDFWI